MNKENNVFLKKKKKEKKKRDAIYNKIALVI
jgi:hypothetical protein